MKNLGMVKFKSVHDGYLQAYYPNGEMHASNGNQNQEETWFLYEIDPNTKQYALANFRNQKFLCKNGGGQGGTDVVCNRDQRQEWETWTLIPGEKFGLPGRVCFQAYDGDTMATNKPGANFPKEPGEVYTSPGKPSADGGWAGWWSWTPVTQAPEPGNDFFSAVGGVIGGIVNVVAKLDIEAVVSVLVVV
jgi:hypothetical protein